MHHGFNNLRSNLLSPHPFHPESMSGASRYSYSLLCPGRVCRLELGSRYAKKCSKRSRGDPRRGLRDVPSQTGLILNTGGPQRNCISWEPGWGRDSRAGDPRALRMLKTSWEALHYSHLGSRCSDDRVLCLMTSGLSCSSEVNRDSRTAEQPLNQILTWMGNVQGTSPTPRCFQERGREDGESL